jgi:hypothetical protein
MKYDVELWIKYYAKIDAANPEEASDIALDTWHQYLENTDILGIDVYDESGELVGGSQ